MQVERSQIPLTALIFTSEKPLHRLLSPQVDENLLNVVTPPSRQRCGCCAEQTGLTVESRRCNLSCAIPRMDAPIHRFPAIRVVRVSVFLRYPLSFLRCSVPFPVGPLLLGYYPQDLQLPTEATWPKEMSKCRVREPMHVTNSV